VTAARFEAEVMPLVPKLRKRARQFAAGRDGADDLVQEALLRAWKAWGRYEVQSVWDWLWLIMRNVYLDARRSAKTWSGLVDGHTSEIADVRGAPPPPPDQHVTSGVGDEVLHEIRRLRGTQRQVIELQMIGLDDEETARQLQINIKTVRSAACKARKSLRATI
jgi:RNA polymerase sigma-70 factor (ECF subfamily)